MNKSKEEIHREYLLNKVNPIFEKLMLELIHHKPEKVVKFMENWINEKGRKLEEELDKKRGSTFVNAYGEESDEEDFEEVGELEFNEKMNNAKKKNSRTSVSAEVYGVFNKKSQFKPKIINKTEDQIQRIRKRLENSFMFSSLEEKEKLIVIGSFEERKFEEGDTIINQGEDGENLFVVDQGELDCFKKFKGNEERTHLKIYYPGEAFGELALLYNAPRAATIIAKTQSVLFALDRECFNHIVKDAASKRRKIYEDFLAKIELLQDIDPYERTQIADSLQPVNFSKGDYVFREGDKGDSFYFIVSGEAKATKILSEGKEPEIVLDYKENEYFGELSLLRDTPRAANIIATTDLSLASIDRKAFKRLIGPLEDILKRNFQRYQKFVY